jgi:addiction module RelE/StbE family toxin
MRVVTSKKFDKQFKKLPQKVQMEFRKRIELFLMDRYHPMLGVHKLTGNLKNLWSFSVTGDIRVVFDKVGTDNIVLVAIGSHSELYS